MSAAIAMALAKGVASAVLGGAVPYLICSKAALAPFIKIPATGLGAAASFIYYARVWIQGYYFDKRCNVTVSLDGKVAVITGGTCGGLGYASAEILAKMGATVVLTVRSKAKGDEAVAALKRSAGHDRISYLVVDFLSKSSVRQGAEAILAAHPRLDILVLNAGTAGGSPADMWMSNQVGPFLFTELLTARLVETARAHDGVRVVAVSSGAHKRAAINYDDPYSTAASDPFGGPYGQSKLAQIMHMREMQRRLREEPGLAGEQAVRCISITPGFALTNLTASKIPRAAMPLVWLLARSAHGGAQAVKMACVDPDVPGGSYISNCYVKQTEGAGNCSNSAEEWKKHWALCETCVQDSRYP
eukprot:TRINITY_DN26893_c0_g1_i1.p1 TRINITY_DN26893_c0_g1~~TRINITY_DN26893_c0_g1_i1.p1  ORF type:complete len:359 (+),score=65.41 TRINITY_DN26893_c0_g1_i1:101-1177(+)